jgi:hypothetical protein
MARTPGLRTILSLRRQHPTPYHEGTCAPRACLHVHPDSFFTVGRACCDRWGQRSGHRSATAGAARGSCCCSRTWLRGARCLRASSKQSAWQPDFGWALFQGVFRRNANAALSSSRRTCLRLPPYRSLPTQGGDSARSTSQRALWSTPGDSGGQSPSVLGYFRNCVFPIHRTARPGAARSIPMRRPARTAGSAPRRTSGGMWIQLLWPPTATRTAPPRRSGRAGTRCCRR